MIRKYSTLLLLFFTCLVSLSFAQDSTNLLSFEAFLDLVKSNHPMARQANIQLEKADAELLGSRGSFDPKLYTKVNQKYFSDDQYFSLINGGIVIPTNFGLKIKTGYETNEGIYLDPSKTVPESGLYYAGLSLSLGQGLLIDERRADLRKAKIYLESSQQDQRAMMNNLIFDASKAYWEWFQAYNNLDVYTNALRLAKQRMTAVKSAARFGDRPAVDTLEAGIQVQNRMLNVQQSELDYIKASAKLSVYLWDENFIPLQLNTTTIPFKIANVEPIPLDLNIVTNLDSLVLNHPELRQYDFKIQQLEIDRRWKREQLKPEVNINYNPISEPINGNPFAEYSINNYTWGMSVSMPLFLRKERGGIQLMDLKIQETELTINNKQASLLYKANASINDWNTSVQQYKLYQQTVKDYLRLLNAEKQLFDGGESSLFMVNSRELGYINAQVKLIELLAKNRKADIATLFSLGLLVN